MTHAPLRNELIGVIEWPQNDYIDKTSVLYQSVRDFQIMNDLAYNINMGRWKNLFSETAPSEMEL